MATCHTLKLAIDFICMTTLITALTGILRINRDNPAKLVIAIGIKASPSNDAV